MIRRAAILSTGDELVTGRTVDTNANFIAEKLVAAGLDVVTVIVVGDYPDRIEWAWNQAMEHADLVVSTGGLGPTADDRSTETVAAATGRPLVFDEAIADRIRQMFAAMGRTMPENNLKQAHFPAGAIVIPNSRGTAPGFRLEIERHGATRHLVVLPGVPREMKPMLDEHVLPWLASMHGADEIYLSRVFQTFGLSESALDEMVAACIEESEARIAFRAAFPQISVRLTVHDSAERAPARLQALADRLHAALGVYIYGEGDTNMETEVGRMLVAAGKTVALAESCTGGMISSRMTDVPGSSAYFVGGVVAYSNAIKEAQLGVAAATLATHGAVSEQTAAEMATGVRRLSGADIGVAVTGIAGPEGGSAEKPVGTVCIGMATAADVISRRYQFWGNRDWVKILSSQVALDWVRRYLLGLDPKESGVLRR